MPNAQPFTLLWTTFTNAPAGQSVPTSDVELNVEAIYNIFSESGLTITKYAVVGIIAASYVFAGLNPARVIQDGLVTSDSPVTTATAYGLWGDINNTNLDDGYTQTQKVITDISHTRHYSKYSDFFAVPPIDTPSLSDYLSSGNDRDLGWYWILNYILYNYVRTPGYFTYAFITECRDAYTDFLYYINNTPRQYNPVAIAILKKRKRKWYQ